MVALSRTSFSASALHDVPGRLLSKADALHGSAEVLRAGRLLLQADALRRPLQILRAKRLLLQAFAADLAALPNAALHLRPTADLQLRTSGLGVEARDTTTNAL